MKKYFITSDVHGFYSELTSELTRNNFLFGHKDHILVICGDVFDRGKEAKRMLKFLLELQKQDRLILIRGNHEDLMEDCLFQLEQRVNISMHHWSNGTVDTIEQLTGFSKYDLICGLYNFREIKERMADYFELVSKAVDYFEIGDYILVHGWIPYILEDSHCKSGELSAVLKPRFILANDKEMWDKARWLNGMKEANAGIIFPDKTIVCGHYHTGYGFKNILHTHLDEFDCFDIYRNKGIIALDSCVAYSHKLNILVLESE